MPPTPKKFVTCKTRHDPAKAMEESLKKNNYFTAREAQAAAETDGALVLRPFQKPIVYDHKSGVVVLHWSRQIGKSFALAAWAVMRVLDNPGRLVTVLSNSRENGAEFLTKCVEVCNLERRACLVTDKSETRFFQAMRLELKVKSQKGVGRIKVLAANPRTARGFSGDLILDEFAFHEDSAAIWEAAEPILASNRHFLCRIASTGNGKHNLFYRMVAEATAGNTDSDEATNLRLSKTGFRVSRVTRTQAHAQGVKIFDPFTRAEITPAAARVAALDKRAYDQNYECSFADENLTLLSHTLLSAAENDDVGFICEQEWSAAVVRPVGSAKGCLEFLREASGRLYVGFDVGRKVDMSVITVVEKCGELFCVRAILRLRDMRLPEQQLRLGEICRLPKFQRASIDMTGLGLGLFEYAQNEFGASRIHGINFATTVPATRAIAQEGRKRETVRVTEALALELLQAYEDRRVQHPSDGALHDDLRKPERITSASGQVSIAATRNEAGHADHFWSLALAVNAAVGVGGEFAYEAIQLPARRRGEYRLIL